MTQPQDRRMRLDVVIVSTREDRFGQTVTCWFAKPFASVLDGGLASGLRAVEHLQLVLAERHAVTIRGTVSVHDAHGLFAADGKPLDQHGRQEAAANMLHQRSWRARSLLLTQHERATPGLTTNYRLSRAWRERAIVGSRRWSPGRVRVMSR